MECPNCNKIYDDDFDFCPYCGVKKPRFNTCPNCIIEVSPAYKFCPYCGGKLLTYEEGKEKLITAFKEKYQSPNTIQYLIEKIEEGMIKYMYQVEDQTLLYGFEPKDKSDFIDIIISYRHIDQKVKNDLINEVNQNKITDLDTLEERKKIRQEQYNREKQKEKEKEKTKEMRKYYRDLYR